MFRIRLFFRHQILNMEQLNYLITIRAIHIFTGVFWAGASIYLAWFVLPAVKKSGPEGGRFMQQLAQTNNLPVIMSMASILNVLTGVLLLWKVSGGFQTTWLFSKHGIICLAGSILTLVPFFKGLLVTRKAALQMNALSEEVVRAGGPPSEQQAMQLSFLRKKISNAISMAAWLLAAAVICMSLLRYL